MPNRSILAILLIFLWAGPALADTRVWLMYGMGDNAFGSSSGINVIAQKAAHIRGVTQVNVRNYWETQRIFNEAMSAPSGAKIILGGYSCGANSATVIPVNMPRRVYVVGIQSSLWCGGHPLRSNVVAAQETYGGCIITLGFGCQRYRAAPGYHVPIKLIRRNDIHPWADDDPRAQRDVLRFISWVATRR